MSFIPIYESLKNSSDVMALIKMDKTGDPQIYEDMAPMTTKPNGEQCVSVPPPYIVWQAISGQANNHLDAPANFDDTQYQVMVYAATRKQAYELRDAARRTLETLSWINNPSINQHDPSTKLYGRGFDANWILAR